MRPQHLEELAAKELAAAANGVSAHHAQQPHHHMPGSGGGKRGGGSGVVEQVLQLNNELFMVPEALFRCARAWGYRRLCACSKPTRHSGQGAARELARRTADHF